jgi:hypothetical protein
MALYGHRKHIPKMYAFTYILRNAVTLMLLPHTIHYFDKGQRKILVQILNALIVALCLTNYVMTKEQLNIVFIMTSLVALLNNIYLNNSGIRWLCVLINAVMYAVYQVSVYEF